MKEPNCKVSVSGAILVLFSFLVPSFIQHRPNRVSTGISMNAMALFGNSFWLLLFISLFILAMILIYPKKSKVFIVNLSFALTGLLLYQLGIALKQGSLNVISAGRISLGGGIWLFILGIYMILNGLFKGSKEAILHRRIGYTLVFIIFAGFLISGHLDDLSIMKEFFIREQAFFSQVNRHFFLSFSSVMTAVMIGIPAGMLIYKSRKKNHPALFLVNLGQTIPTLSLLGLMMAPLTFLGEQSQFLKNIGIRGVGFTPAFIVLIIYALFPIMHNTIAGLKLVDHHLLEVAYSLGMENKQVFWKVQLPLSLPVILGGIRTAMTQSIGNTILAGLIGGGGLGSIIFLGLAQAAPDLILVGIIPMVLMAFIVDSFFSIFVFYIKRNFPE